MSRAEHRLGEGTRQAGAARSAALAAVAQWPAAQPIASVAMNSAGRLLIVGEAGASLGWAEKLRGKLETTVLATRGWASAELPCDERYTVLAGRVLSLTGHLGAFTLEWQAEGDGKAAADSFDLVLDLCHPPLNRSLEPPEGYQAPGGDPLAQALAVIELLPLTGEFEKPQYVTLRENRCAHSRAKLSGCNRCLDVCSTGAIVAKGDSVAVDPYLCQGCGTCATVCPSGALSFQYPRVADVGERMRAMLAAYRDAGGVAPCLLFHSATAGRELLARVDQRHGGLPPRVVAIETWSADAVGLDLMLAAIALGASQVAVLAAGSRDAGPLLQQAGIGEEILAGLGYAGEHLRVFAESEAEPLLAALGDWQPAEGVKTPADFRPQNDKRGTLDLAIAHLRTQARQPPEIIPLSAGAPFGSVSARDACTLCMGCVSACPASALVGGTDSPRLAFVEHNCLQCGLCVQSCPEGALSLSPQLLLAGARRERLLRQAEVFRCTGCGKPMGARPLIEAVAARLAGHAMFAAEAARARLKMCGDCRVIDLLKHEQSLQASEMKQ